MTSIVPFQVRLVVMHQQSPITYFNRRYPFFNRIDYADPISCEEAWLSVVRLTPND